MNTLISIAMITLAAVSVLQILEFNGFSLLEQSEVWHFLNTQ